MGSMENVAHVRHFTTLWDGKKWDPVPGTDDSLWEYQESTGSRSAWRISESPARQIMEKVLRNDGNLPDMQWDFDLKQVWNWLTDTALGVSVMEDPDQNVWHVPSYPRQKNISDAYLSVSLAGGCVHLVVAASDIENEVAGWHRHFKG